MFVTNCPVVWLRKLQTEIAMSTMEVEYIALSTVLKSLIPFKCLVEAFSLAVGLDPQKIPTSRLQSTKTIKVVLS